MLKTLAAAAIALAATAAASAAQDERPCRLETPCKVETSEYALVFPAEWDGEAALKPFVFFHGHNSSMASTARSGGLRDSFVTQGYLLIAPQGERSGEGRPRRWPARPGAGWRDDVAYTLSVLDDVAKRVPLEGRAVVSGFSAGGSMAWMMGCYEGARVSAVMSVAGALRRPNPETCEPMAPRAFHVHGFADAQVPFEGRAIRDWHQGDVRQTLALFRRSHGCRSNPGEITIGEHWRARVWTSCADDADLAYLEHDGGHGLPPGWSDIAARWLETGVLSLDGD